VRRRGHKTAPWSNTDTREYCIKPLIGASSRIEEGIDFSVRHKLAIFPVVTVACRPRAIVPVTHGLVFLLIHVSARSLVETLIVLLAVPFSAVGAIWLFYPLHCEMSMAVWAGLIGLLSIDAETCAFRAALPRLAMRGRETARLSQHSGRVAPGHSLRRGKQAPTHIYYLFGDLQWPVPVMWPSGTGSEK